MGIFNRKSEEEVSRAPSRQIQLGPIHLAVLFGFTLGCIVVGYLLGYHSGHQNGLETALATNLASTVRIPFSSSSEENKTKNEDYSEIYAKLKDPVAVPKKDAKPPEVDPSVQAFMASSPSSQQPVAPVAQKGSIEKSDSKNDSGKQVTLGQLDSDHLGASSSSAATMGARVLGAGSAPVEQKTLGDLFGDTKQNTVKLADEKKNDKSESAKELAKSNEKAQEQAAKKAKEAEQAAAAKLAADKKSKQEEEKKKQLELAAKAKEKEDANTGTVLKSGWYAQIAAPKSSQEANNIARSLRTSGFAVVIETAKVRDEQYYRIVVGPEDNRQQAERLVQQLKREPTVKSEPFIRMVR